MATEADFGRWAHHATHRGCILQSRTGNPCNCTSQCRPNKFNKTENTGRSRCGSWRSTESPSPSQRAAASVDSDRVLPLGPTLPDTAQPDVCSRATEFAWLFLRLARKALPVVLESPPPGPCPRAESQACERAYGPRQPTLQLLQLGDPTVRGRVGNDSPDSAPERVAPARWLPRPRGQERGGE